MSEHFLPFRRQDLVAACLAEVEAGQADDFRRGCALLQQVFHHEFHQRLEALKDAFAPLDPNADTRALPGAPARDRAVAVADLWRHLGALLERANYDRVSGDELNRALTSQSLFEVRLHTRLDDFAELHLFARGRRTRTETLRRWFGLRKRTITVEYYERAVIALRFQDQAWFEQPGRAKRVLPFQPGAISLKLFENVPAADLEMLFPNTEVRMRPIDHATLWVPALLGGIGVALKAGLPLLAVGALIWSRMQHDGGWRPLETAEKAALGIAAGAAVTIGMFAVRQYGRFKNKKIEFMKALTESLYFKNLDNNAGVFHRLLDEAEEEEVKEAVLGWCFLVRHGPATQAQLDAAIEAWFRTRCGAAVDFEVDDALAKLARLGLAQEVDGRWQALAFPAGVERLRQVWQGLAG